MSRLTALERRLRRDAEAWSRRVPPGTPVAVRVSEDGAEHHTRTRSAALWDAGHLECYVVGHSAPVSVGRVRPLDALRPRRYGLVPRLAPALR